MDCDIRNAIITHIQTNCPQGDDSLVIDEATRLDELVMDSLELLELIFALESQFGVETDEAQLGAVQTLGDIIMLVQRAQTTEAA